MRRVETLESLCICAMDYICLVFGLSLNVHRWAALSSFTTDIVLLNGCPSCQILCKLRCRLRNLRDQMHSRGLYYERLPWRLDVRDQGFDFGLSYRPGRIRTLNGFPLSPW
jgi:hypothetical protein